jgi:hypothetical protein
MTIPAGPLICFIDHSLPSRANSEKLAEQMQKNVQVKRAEQNQKKGRTLSIRPFLQNY